MLSSDWLWGLSILAPAFQHYKMLSGARVCLPSLYLLCHWSPDHCNLTRAGSDMWSNLSSQHQPIRGLHPALWTNERLEMCDIWPMREPCRNVSIAMISYRWQKLDNNEWGECRDVCVIFDWQQLGENRFAKLQDILGTSIFLFFLDLCHKIQR